MPDESSVILTPGEVAEMFKVSVTTVAKWADDDKLPSFRTPGGTRRFRRHDIEALIASDQIDPDKAAS